MLGHGLDEARVGRIVIELPAQGLDALGQRLVGDRDAAPDLAEEAVLGDQPPSLADEQGEGVEITGVELDRRVVAAELAIGRIEGETVETEAAWTSLFRVSSAVAHDAHRHRRQARLLNQCMETG